MSDDSYRQILSTQLKRTSAALAASTPLPRAPAGNALPLADSRGSRGRAPRRRYLYGLGAGVAVAVAVPLVTLGIFPGGSGALTKIHLPGLTITALAQSQAAPQLSSQQANAVALAYLDETHGNVWRHAPMDFTGYSITNTTFESEVTEAVWQCGSLSLPSPQNVWVIEASAPPQQGWNVIKATVLVNDDAGRASWLMNTSSNGTITLSWAFSSAPQGGATNVGSSLSLAGCQ